MDYKDHYEENEEKYAAKCTGRWNCVGRYVQRKFMDGYNRTTFGHFKYEPVIDRDRFSSTEWNTTYLGKISKVYPGTNWP